MIEGVLLFDYNILLRFVNNNTFAFEHDFFTDNITIFGHFDSTNLNSNYSKKALFFAILLSINHYS